MEWHVVKPGKDRKKLQIRGELPDGRVVKLPGHRDRHIAQKMCDNIASLHRSKMFGELPDPKLADWIAGLPEWEAARYVEEGLLDRRFLDKRRPIDDLLQEHHAEVTIGCKADSTAADMKIDRIKRIFAAIASDTKFDDLTVKKVVSAVTSMVALSGQRKGQSLSHKTRCEYYAAIKSFCGWMLSEKKTSSNPLIDLDISGAYRAPVRKRRPIDFKDFCKFATYLRNAPAKSKGQKRDWTPYDRLMIYWTAVMTGLRFKELSSLTPANCDFEAETATITINGWDTKNTFSAKIPIGSELAAELKKYSTGLAPNVPLLKMSGQSQFMCLTLRRDLDAAGIPHKFADGSMVDFHTLRSTAICWWLRENKLSLVDVQHYARLRTLELVQRYVDDYVPKHAELVKGTPKLFGETVHSTSVLVAKDGAQNGAQ